MKARGRNMRRVEERVRHEDAHGSVDAGGAPNHTCESVEVLGLLDIAGGQLPGLRVRRAECDSLSRHDGCSLHRSVMSHSLLTPENPVVEYSGQTWGLRDGVAKLGWIYDVLGDSCYWKAGMCQQEQTSSAVRAMRYVSEA